MIVHLEPCPFCGCDLKRSPHRVNPWAICPTEGCIGARQTIVLDDPKQVTAWNRRSDPMRAITAEISRLDLKPDDVVVIRFNRPVTPEALERARAAADAVLPIEQKVLILGPDVDLTVTP